MVHVGLSGLVCVCVMGVRGEWEGGREGVGCIKIHVITNKLPCLPRWPSGSRRPTSNREIVSSNLTRGDSFSFTRTYIHKSKLILLHLSVSLLFLASLGTAASLFSLLSSRNSFVIAPAGLTVRFHFPSSSSSSSSSS